MQDEQRKLVVSQEGTGESDAPGAHWNYTKGILDDWDWPLVWMDKTVARDRGCGVDHAVVLQFVKVVAPEMFSKKKPLMPEFHKLPSLPTLPT